MIWLIGAKGMLGTELRLLLEGEGLAHVCTDIDVDITDPAVLSAFARRHPADWIINASAYTAVDKAESEEAKAYSINADGPGNIAAAAAEQGTRLVHFSTDYVFDGSGTAPYKETDPTGPISAYGRTKLAGEEAIRDRHSRHFIFRISWLYGAHGPNFVKTMLRLMAERDTLGVVADQKGSPTYARQLANNIISLIRSDSTAYGTYHYADDGVISWHDFAMAIYAEGQQAGVLTHPVTINAITTDQYPTPAKRPAWSAFDKTKVISRLEFTVRGWRENLQNYFKETISHG